MNGSGKSSSKHNTHKEMDRENLVPPQNSSQENKKGEMAIYEPLEPKVVRKLAVKLSLLTHQPS